MTTQRWNIGLVSLLAACMLYAAPEKACYVIDSRNKKHEGIELRVKSAQGDLELNVDGRIKIPFKAGNYSAAYIPKPPDVAALEASFEGEHYAAVIKVAGSAFDKYKFLGWGDFIAYLEGMSLVKTGNPQGALKVFLEGRQFRGNYSDELIRGIVLALLDMKEVEKVQPMLAGMIKSTHKTDAVFAFNSRARILADAGKNKEAVLEYLKVLLFFEDSSSVRDLREEARTRAVEIMKKMNDGRWKTIEDIK